jgi:hypothetical protein
MVFSCSEEENSQPVPFTFAPTLGKVGSVVTIKGNFDFNLPNTVVLFGYYIVPGSSVNTLKSSDPAKILWISDSGHEMKVEVPANAISGHLSLTQSGETFVVGASSVNSFKVVK